MIGECDLSERRACRLVGLSRDSYRNPPEADAMTQELSNKIVEIAHARRRFGYRRIHDMLRPHFPGVNHKRVYRLYSAANLAVRKRRKVKRPASERVPLQLATTVNEVWSMDFVSDSLSTGRRIKCLTVADDFSHECVSISVDWGISGRCGAARRPTPCWRRELPRCVPTNSIKGGVMAIDAISSATSGTNLKASSLGMEDFLKILLTQLTYQDPLKPMDNQQFMAQMAQFTNLEQTQQLNNKIETLITNQAALQSVGLIGRKVDITTTGGAVTGTVDALSLAGDTPLLTVLTAAGATLSDDTQAPLRLHEEAMPEGQAVWIAMRADDEALAAMLPRIVADLQRGLWQDRQRLPGRVQRATGVASCAQYVTRLLDQAAVFRGYPLAVRTDNGPEFTSRAFMGWAQTHGIRHILIEPGRPMQNGYIESFNGKFRDECLNEQWFETLQQARSAIKAWRQDYNEVRPHSSCQRMPPAKFAELHRQRAGDAARSTSTTTEMN